MTIRKSGTITLGEIGTEYKDARPNSISEFRGRLWLLKPSLRNTPTSFSQFYGARNVVTIDVLGTSKNYSIEIALKSRRVNDAGIVYLNINSGSRIGSSSTGLPAMRTGINCGALGAVIHLHVKKNAHIIGKGGNGGSGGSNSNGGNGLRGGDGLRVESSGRTVRITNEGVIAGGGGGGGGGGSSKFCFKATKAKCTKYGTNTGQGGRAGVGDTNGSNGARNRTTSSIAKKSSAGGIGGVGGAWGKSGGRGSDGSGGTTNWKGGGGGAPGYAVRKVAGSTVYVKVGDIRGARQ